MSSGEATTDHDVSRQWAELRGGRPTRVKGTESRDGSGVLRFDFNEPDETLEEISWDEFFETFDDRELALLYQDKTADGQTSRFFTFIHRRDGDEGESGHRATDEPHGGLTPALGAARPAEATSKASALAREGRTFVLG